MTEPHTSTTAESRTAAAAEFLTACPGAILLTHERPDGDAIGSVAGLAHYLHATQRFCEIWLYAAPPERYAHLLGGLVVKVLDLPRFPDRRPDPARVWVLSDTCAFGQVAPVAEAVRARGGVDWVFDHHLARDPIARSSGPDGRPLGYIDETASATGLLIFEAIAATGFRPSPMGAEALFTAIATDTGWFRFPSTDPRTYRAIATLVEWGAAPADIYERLFQTDSPSRIGLVREALGGLELLEGGRVAIMTLNQEIFRRVRATSNDTENLTDEAARIRGVNVTALLVEMGDGRVRCSLRSKRGVDVNAIAVGLGGGGHARASGARMTGSLAEVKARLLPILCQAQREYEGQLAPAGAAPAGSAPAGAAPANIGTVAAAALSL